MNVLIDNRGGVPIYDQIYSQIKRQILSGELKENEVLPSIRGLAKDLRISFITTKRAYEELEREGYIFTVPAKGCYVAARNKQLMREDNLRKMEEHIDKLIELARICEIDRDSLIGMLDFGMEEEG